MESFKYFIFGSILIVGIMTLDSCRSPENVPSGFTLVWQDEFDYSGLPDSTRWSYDTAGNRWGWGNKELQYYTYADRDNAYVSEGTLKITARKKSIGGKSYSSARLVSKNKGDWLYGRIDVKAKLPEGRGLWPAIWMLPTDSKYGGWPDSGEIDIMEHVGFNPDTVFASAHTKSYNHVNGTQKTSGIYLENPYSAFHLFSLEWEEDEYRVYIDKKQYFTFQNEKTGWEEWPFDQQHYLILNLAVGGDWGGQKGIDDQVFPESMEVDYVRIYKKKE